MPLGKAKAINMLDQVEMFPQNDHNMHILHINDITIYLVIRKLRAVCTIVEKYSSMSTI